MSGKTPDDLKLACRLHKFSLRVISIIKAVYWAFTHYSSRRSVSITLSRTIRSLKYSQVSRSTTIECDIQIVLSPTTHKPRASFWGPKPPHHTASVRVFICFTIQHAAGLTFWMKILPLGSGVFSRSSFLCMGIESHRQGICTKFADRRMKWPIIARPRL